MKITKLTFICLILLLTLPGCSRDDSPEGQSKPVTIRLGHVGHDHHLALFVAADNADKYHNQTQITLKLVEDRKLYELFEAGQKLADIEIVKVGGGSRMPAALAQNVIDVGFGGVAPVLASIDQGVPIRLISPLHYKGDMFVAQKDFQADNWSEFVELVRTADRPIRIGYKSPVAVAKVIFEQALSHEKITFSSDISRADVQVHMINTKGGGKLNVALSGDLIDAYAGNNPFAAMAVEKGIGKVICDLEELPPGNFRNHPCCCIAAREEAIKNKGPAIRALLVLFLQANQTINTDLEAAVDAATRWIGTSQAVERKSIPTSGYSMQPDQIWRQTMDEWIKAMDDLEVFTERFRGLEPAAVSKATYDFSLLRKASQKLETENDR